MISPIENKKEKKWILRENLAQRIPEETVQMARDLAVSPIVAQLLINRGYTDAASARSFLHMESEMLCDPFLLRDIEPAIARIRRALECGERITVYGDYDVDGVTSVCTLYLFLRRYSEHISYYIPNRANEGYGVSKSAIEKLAGEGTGLIITVDTGITANEEVLYAASLGVDVVVTDHHECRSELPEAVAVINPHRPDCPYPFKELAGVGVVFKLICALQERLTGQSRLDAVGDVCRHYADLVAIGTIADVMPIRDENKLIVSYGLHLIEHTARPGLVALMEAAANRTGSAPAVRKRKTRKITSGYIGYTLAPRINAAGRIRSATEAVELFLAEDPDEAKRLAEDLCEANRERQTEENRIMEEAFEKIYAEHDFEHDPVIVLDSDGWHHGIIGIVASRITEKFGLPSILVSFEGCGLVYGSDDVGKGSGRSIKGLNLVDALVHCSDCLVKFGGHELAAGLSVTRANLPLFRARINEYARSVLSEEAMTPTLEGDCILKFSDITLSLAQELQLLEPYGVGNPVPVFALFGVEILESAAVSGGRHTRFTLGTGDGHVLQAMCFGSGMEELSLFAGDLADLMFTVDINEWNGRKSVQLIIKDIRRSEEDGRRRAQLADRFETIRAGGSFSPEEHVLPCRADFAATYTVIRRLARMGIDSFSHRVLLTKIHTEYGGDVNSIKLRFIILIFKELNLLTIQEQGDRYTVRLHNATTKTDLEKSTLLRRLRGQERHNGQESYHV